MNRLLELIDNPILVKHVRTRLRPGQTLPWIVVVGVLCILISYAGFESNWFANGTAFGFLLGIQFVLLVIVGASQIASTVGGARESGIIDFHRVSPLSPLSITLGFFFGGPIREYLLYACTLPFMAICVAYGAPNFLDFFQITGVLFLSTWVFHGVSLFSSLANKKPKAGIRGILGVIIFLFFMSNSLIFGIGNATSLARTYALLSFYGVELPWTPFVLIYTSPMITFLLIASTRKMRSERAHSLSKPQAVACMGIAAFLLVGVIWKVNFDVTLVVVYLLSAMALLLSVTITPNLGDYVKGIRRAEKQGLKGAGIWNDFSLNRVAAACIAGVLLVGSTVTWQAVRNGSSSIQGAQVYGYASPATYSVTIAAAVFVILYSAFALQFFLLRFGGRGASFMGMFLFLVWIVPLVLGGILAGSGAPEGAYQLILAISPIAGFAVSSGGDGSGVAATTLQAATIFPAIIFFFLFNNLVTYAKRRVDEAIHSGPERKPAPVEAIVELS